MESGRINQPFDAASACSRDIHNDAADLAVLVGFYWR
jgi:hypothetical protein